MELRVAYRDRPGHSFPEAEFCKKRECGCQSLLRCSRSSPMVAKMWADSASSRSLLRLESCGCHRKSHYVSNEAILDANGSGKSNGETPIEFVGVSAREGEGMQE